MAHRDLGTANLLNEGDVKVEVGEGLEDLGIKAEGDEAGHLDGEGVNGQLVDPHRRSSRSCR